MPQAQVIAFPATRRLETALERLRLAQERQSAALALFRESLGQLQEETRRLDLSAQEWRAELGRCGQRAEETRQAAETLALTASRMAAGQA